MRMPRWPSSLRLADQLEDGVHVGDDRRDHRDADAAVRVLRTKSASQRLWARLPGDRLARVAVDPAAEAGAERRRRDPTGAEHVGVGEQHLGGDALSSSTALRASESYAAVSPPSPSVSSSHSSRNSLRSRPQSGSPGELLHPLLVLVEPLAEPRSR